MKKPSKDKVKGFISKLYRISVILAAVILIAFIFTKVTTNKYGIKMNNTSEYSQMSDFETTYVVTAVKKYGKNTVYTGKELNVKAELLNSNEKKVGKVKAYKDKVYAEQANSMHLDIPDDLEDGKYNVRVKVRRGLYNDTFIIPINISSAGDMDITTAFDKGIYKPGDKVSYRLLLTDKLQNKPIEEEILVNIFDGNDNKVYTNTAKTSDFGIISGEFQLGDEVNSGYYSLKVYVGNSLAKADSFYVEPYEQPLFEVIASPDKEVYKTNDVIQLNIGANYFFGENVQTAKKITIKDDSGTIIFDRSDYELTSEPVFVGEATEKEGKFNYTIEVTDNSNYVVQKQVTTYVCNDDIQIEVLPEFGSLISRTNNNIYIITKTPKGEPVETIGSIQKGSVKKDFATNANGIGLITISAQDISATMSEPLQITAQNAEGISITKKVYLEESSSPLYVKTNKSVYDVGEDIILNYASDYETDQVSIVLKKGDKVLKTVSAGDGEEIVNLGDNYGIIDICMGAFSKTIFIKPNKDLKLVASTNLEEYKPGDEMKLSISSEGVNGKEDTALLISILDKANLSLRDNDLTINNIKLALADVKLTDGFTAADLYAALVANKSEVDITALLLRTEVDTNVISESQTRSVAYDNSDKLDIKIAVLVVYIVVFIFLLIVSAISAKFRNTTFKTEGLKKFFTGLCTAIVLSPILFIFDNFFGLILLVVAVIYVYRNFSIKYKDQIYLTCVDTIKSAIIIISSALVIATGAELIVGFITEYFDYPSEYILPAIGLVLFLVVDVNFIRMGRKGLKNCIGHFLYTVIKSAIICVITAIILEVVSDKLGYRYDYYEEAMLLIAIASVLGFNYLFVRKQKNEEVDTKEFKFSAVASAGLFLLVIAILVGGFILSIIRSFSSNIYEASEPLIDVYDSSPTFNYSGSSSSGGGLSRDAAIDVKFDSVTDTSGAGSSLDDLSSKASKFLSKGFASSAKVEQDLAYENDIIEDTNVEETAEGQTTGATQKIRNVFLESLAFLPDVVAENGYTEETIKLSDNITTWKIQVVGNTKGGEIGYTTEEFKVFKDFFVNYTTPNNLKVGDVIKLPVTVYNYTENALEVNLEVKPNDWSRIDTTNYSVTVDSNGTQLVYIPIEITKAGENSLRIDAKAGANSDIIEKTFNVANEGYKIEEVKVNGFTNSNVSETVNFTANHIEGSEKIKVKIYPNSQSQIIENIDSMLRLPTGCFEQVSSSLYPDILILQYLNDSKEENDEIKAKALEYINKGYQKLLTYEVKGEKGGYSLYGHSPASPYITAYGLLEFSELEKVYEIDENVIPNMIKYLEKNVNFKSYGDYTAWCIVESGKATAKLENECLKYIKDNIEDETSIYDYALLTAAYNRLDPGAAEKYVKNLITKVEEKLNGTDTTYRDRYYCRSPYSYYSNQNVEIYSLLSMILSDSNSRVKDNKLNEKLIEEIYKSKTTNSWGSTQKGAFALRAINQYNTNGKLEKQTLKVTFGGDTQEIKIDKDILSFYELEFTKVDKTNSFSIDGIKSNIAYEVIQSYNVKPDDIEQTNKFLITRNISNMYSVNDIVNEEIKVSNNSSNDIMNGIIEVEIPTGFKVLTDKLDEAVFQEKISKYEYNNESIKLYITDFNANETIVVPVSFRASYPVRIMTNTIKVYDYYAPEINEVLKPIQIEVNG